jgi:hypothetical protein
MQTMDIKIGMHDLKQTSSYRVLDEVLVAGKDEVQLSK